jgi:hypothetical protein
MTKKSSFFALFLILLFTAVSAHAQSSKSVYDHHAAFAPNFMTDNGNLLRSANGTPGKKYWQNEADYTVKAELDTASKSLNGKVLIHYTNNSPDSLHQLWLQLVHNISHKNSIASSMHGMRSFFSSQSPGKTGFTLHKVRIKTGGSWQDADYTIYGTRMQIRLPDKLKGEGKAIKIKIKYDLKLPKHGRTSYLKTKNGTIFDVSYWYPRMCVYDDIKGWNTLPYLGSEFYLDYGDIDYKVTLPAGMLMAGNGKLMNPKETLTSTEYKRFQKAHHTGETVMIRPEDELDQPATAKGKNGRVTWHYHMKNTRDVAWSASKAFIWDAATAAPDNGKDVLVESFYPIESAGKKRWGRDTQYLKFDIEYFSNQWFPYPYPTAISVGGGTGGMEYPGLAFDSYRAKGYGTFFLITHEIGHTWFPMIVGSNERRNAWMDEGFNVFIDVLAHKNFNNGEYAPKSDGEYAPNGGKPADEIVPVITSDSAQPIMSQADAMTYQIVHPTKYFKTAFGLVLLRNVVLGHKRFDYAFRHYIRAWKYKHPGFKDFFRAMNNFSGADLDWFWRGWFVHNWKLDQAVTGVSYRKDDPGKGALIHLENMDKMPMPVLVRVKTADGKTMHYKLPVQIWEQGAKYEAYIPSKSKITKVQLDPDHKLPDVNRDNNSWPRK